MIKQGELRRGLILCCLMALAIIALRQSPTFLKLSAGASFTAYLMVSRRNWVYLIAGHMLGILATSAPQLSAHGFPVSWLATETVCPPLFAAATMALCRRRLAVYQLNAVSDIWKLISAALIMSVTGALAGSLHFLTLDFHPAAYNTTWEKIFLLYGLGYFTGALSIAPAVLWLRQVTIEAKSHGRAFWLTRKHLHNAFIALLQVGVFFGLFIGVAYIHPDTETIWMTRILILVPLGIVPYFGGWRGVAGFIPLTNIALSLTPMDSIREPNLLLVMQISGLLSSSALFFGMYVATQRSARESARRSEARLRNMVNKFAEMTHVQRRQHAEQADRLYQSMQGAEKQLLRKNVKADDALELYWTTINGFREQLRELRETIQPPPLLEQRGLRIALVSGPIKKLVRDAGAYFHTNLPDDLHVLSEQLQRSLYHATHESAFAFLAAGAPRFIRARIRIGKDNGRRWVALRITAEVAERPADAPVVPGKYVASAEDLARVAIAYGGNCRKYQAGDQHCLTMLFFDESAEAVESTPVEQQAGGWRRRLFSLS